MPIEIRRPAAPLRGYVSHYWLSLGNADGSCAVLPDGAVDVVVAVGAAGFRVGLFGTTTSRADLRLEIGSHYLGVRFEPGQSRHFIDVRAAELTNGRLAADGLLVPDMRGVAESITAGDPFSRLDAVLLAHLGRRPPRRARIDDAIRHIRATQGTSRVSQVVDTYGKGRRQFERDFLDVVGIPAKLFAEIVRFRQAAALLAGSALPLARIAAELGYADQSHLTREFSRFHGHPPSRARRHVAFLQDLRRVPDDTEGSRFA